MQVVEKKWMVYIKIKTDVRPRDILNAGMVDAVVEFYKKKNDWTDLFF